MNVNDAPAQTTPDPPTMRRVAAELAAEAPPPAPWEAVVARSEGIEPARATPATSTKRPLLLAAATIAILAFGLGALVLRGTRSVSVGPADGTYTPTSDVDPGPTTEGTAQTTTTVSDPLSSPSETGAEQQPDITTAPEIDADLDPTDELDPVDEPPAVDLVPTPIGEITRLPAQAWIAPATTPAGYRPIYAADDGPGRRLVYRDETGNDLTILIDPVAIEFGDPVEIDGQTWLIDAVDDDRVTLQRTISLTVIELSAAGLDVDRARPIIESLVAGDDSILPLEPLRPSPDYRQHDLLAIDPGDALTTIRGIGVDGWYCLEISYPAGSSPGCGDGRDGGLSSELRIDGGGSFDEDGSSSLTLSSIVAPAVATIDIVFADGSTISAIPEDPTGRYDDRFWIVTTEQEQPEDPFQNDFVSFEVRLLSEDGTLLGLAPIPDGLG